MTNEQPENVQLRRIRSLLAQAENTPYPAEAETFMEKVSELIARWGIDQALVWASENETTREQPTSATIVIEAPYAARKSVLIGQIAGALGCRAVRTSTGGSTEHIAVLGFPGDVYRVELLATSLLVQLTRALLAGGAQGDARTTAAWRRSFIVAFSTRIGERLRADRANAAATAGDTADEDDASDAGDVPTSTSTDLVLAGRDEAVNDYVKSQFARLRTHRLSSGGNSRGSAAGRAAADNATLDSTGITGGRASIGAGA